MIGAVLLAGLLAVQDGDPPSGDGPIRTTIAEIHEDPWAWHGRTVRVVGDFNVCRGYDCRVCDPGVLFPNSNDVSLGDEGSCAFAGTDLWELGDEVLRYNRVDFVADYDATCSNRTCVDRGVEFHLTGSIRFAEVRAATDFSAAAVNETANYFIDPESAQPVTRAEPELADALEAAIARTFGVPGRIERGYRTFPFQTETLWPPAELIGICIIRERLYHEDVWPTELHQIYRAVGNPYACYRARLDEEGDIIFPPQDYFAPFNWLPFHRSGE